MIRTTLALALALSAASCATSQQKETDRCREYGFKPGSDSYAQCRMNIDMAARNAPRKPLFGPMVNPLEGHLPGRRPTIVCTTSFGTTTCN